MNKSERIYSLDRILKSHRYPVSKTQLMEYLECSQATLYRIIAELRDAYAAPIENNELGFFYSKGISFELPGLRLSSEEIQGLLMMAQLIEDIESEALKKPLDRLLGKVNHLLNENGLSMRKNVRIIRALSRKPDKTIFTVALQALQVGKALNIQYQARSTGEKTQRFISPQQLTCYKNAWYLESWCHLRHAIRSFSLEKISESKITGEVAYKKIPQQKLSKHYSESYGIFSGQASHQAIVHFNQESADWAASECWHPDQQIDWQKNNSVNIHIPFHHSKELLMDILRYGASAEILQPLWLREEISSIIKAAHKKYQKT